jgi:hypothetical protein
MTDIPDGLAERLREPARGSASTEIAAVDLLIWHETWLRRQDFRDAAIRPRGPGGAVIDWRAARAFRDSSAVASSSELTILGVAIALGQDTLGLSGLGRGHAAAVASAFAAAVPQAAPMAPRTAAEARDMAKAAAGMIETLTAGVADGVPAGPRDLVRIIEPVHKTATMLSRLLGELSGRASALQRLAGLHSDVSVNGPGTASAAAGRLIMAISGAEVAVLNLREAARYLDTLHVYPGGGTGD